MLAAMKARPECRQSYQQLFSQRARCVRSKAPNLAPACTRVRREDFLIGVEVSSESDSYFGHRDEPLLSSLVELSTVATKRSQLFEFATNAEQRDGCREFDNDDDEILGSELLISVFLVRKEDGKRLELTQAGPYHESLWQHGEGVVNTRRLEQEGRGYTSWEYSGGYSEYYGRPGLSDVDAQFVWYLRRDTGPTALNFERHVRFEATLHLMERTDTPGFGEPEVDPEPFLSKLSIRLVPKAEIHEHEYQLEDGPCEREERTTSVGELLAMLQSSNFDGRWV